MAISSRIIAAIILMIQSISSLTLLRPEEAPLPPVRPINPGTNQQPQPYYTGETLIFYGNQDPRGLPYRPPSSQPEGPYTPGAPFQGPPFSNPVNPPPGAPFTGPPFDSPASQTPPKYIFSPNNPGIPQSPQQPKPQPFPVYPPPQQQLPVGGYPPQQPPQAPPKQPVNPSAPQRPVVPIPRPDPPINPQTPQQPPPPPPAQEPKDVPPFAPRPEQPAPKGPVNAQPPPQTPGVKDGSASGPSVGGQSRPAGAAGGPIVNAEQDLDNKLNTHEIDVGDKPFIFSKPSQFLIGTLAAFFGLCTLMRCYSKLCWDKSGGRAGGDNGGGNGYDKGAPVSRQNGSIDADVDWSDHTQDEFEEDEDYDDENAMTDVQQCRSRKAREMVPDDSATFSDQDRLGIEQGDVNIIMEEEEEQNINDKECVMTDDETRAIMREFKDTDDEYVD